MRHRRKSESVFLADETFEVRSGHGAAEQVSLQAVTRVLASLLYFSYQRVWYGQH